MNLKNLVFSLASKEGLNETRIDGLDIYRMSNTYPRTALVSPAAICFVISGQKAVYLGDKKYTYNDKAFLVSSVSMPMESELELATKDTPYLGVVLTIDPSLVSELLLEIGESSDKFMNNTTKDLLCSSKMNQNIEDCLFRLLSINNDPLKIKVLGKSLIRELYFNVLISENGLALRNSVANNTNAHKMAPVIKHLEENFKERLEIKQIAKIAGMSKSALYDNFKEATTLSPIQFVKQLRIHNSHKMLLEGESASKAAFDSGYTSQSQFSREFKRYFGYSPKDIRNNM